MTGREFSDAARAIIEAVIHDMQDELASKYAGVITRFAKQAARNYTTLTAGARPDELIDPDDVAREAGKAVDKLRRTAVERVIGETLTVAGIAFDVSPLVVDALTAQIGVRSRDLNRSMLRTLTSTIERASREGWTVPETAAAIEANVIGIAPGTSTMLARTDLIGLANGGSIVAAREVLPEGATKQWLSAEDDRVRPTHEEADGQVVPLNAPFDVGGVALDYPGDPAGPDDEVCNCRCTVIYTDEPVTASATHDEEAAMKGKATVEVTAGAPEIRVPVLMNGEPTGTYLTGTFASGDTAANGAAQYDFTVSPSGVFADDEAPVDDVVHEPLSWVSDLAFEGVATGDGRFIVPGGLSWRQPPLTLLAQTETAAGHDGAGVSGKIETFVKDDKVDMDGNKLDEGVVAIRGTGVFDVGEFGQDIERMVDDEVLRGVSVDLGINEWAFRDPDTGEILVPEEMTPDEWDRAFFGELQFAILDAEIMAATVCATPAFADSRIAVTASAGVDGARLYSASLFAPFKLVPKLAVITASAAGMAPLHPPRSWFENPQLAEPTALTVTDDGQVFGHVETFQCHIGRPDACVPPPSGCSFDLFHVGMLKCDDGSEVSVGQLTMDTDHASIQADVTATIRHYDNTGMAIADVRVGYDSFGTWMAGALRPDVDAVKVRAFKAAKVSGDWRPTRMGHELVAVLVVNSGGYPVPRAQALVASAADGTQETLAIIAAGIVGVDQDSLEPPPGEDTQAIRIRVLAARAESGMSGLAAIVG